MLLDEVNSLTVVISFKTPSKYITSSSVFSSTGSESLHELKAVQTVSH